MYSRGCLSYDLIKKTIGLVNIFCNAIYIYYLKLPYSQYPPLSSRLTNLLKIFDRTTWMLTFLSIFVVHNTFRLLCYIAKKMGYISLEEEITLWPFRYINNFDNFYPIFTLPLHSKTPESARVTPLIFKVFRLIRNRSRSHMEWIS